MNILLTNSARSWGGNEQWLLSVAQALKNDQRVVLIYRAEEIGKPFKVVKHKLPFINEIDVYSLIKLIFFIHKYHIDTIISTKPKEHFLAGIVAKFLKKKHLIRLGIVRDIRHSLTKRFLYGKMSDGIIVNAHQIKKILLKSRAVPAERIKVIYNGIDYNRIRDKTRTAPPAVKPYPFLIGSMGSLIERKGFDRLLRAYALFIRSLQNKAVGLYIIGKGPRQKNLMKLASSLGIASQVTFTGFLDNPYPALNQCDVFVLLSANEGISNALIEAMYLKKAVIASSVGGTAEIIEQHVTGLLVNPDDPHRLSDYFMRLYQDRGWAAQLGQKAHRRAVQTFSMEKMRKQLIDFCHTV